MKTIYSVFQVNTYIHNMFREDYLLSDVSVSGEISNLKFHTSGHIYFTLKDAKSALKAVMFANSAKYLKFRPENGMTVIVKGRISLYEIVGDYRLDLCFSEGKGDLYGADVNIYGSDAEYAVLEMAEHGMVFKSDNMNNIKISVDDLGYYDEMDYATFSTDYDSVNIRNLDRDTFGVYIDSDNDGEYETLIADSNGTDYGTYEKPEDEEPTPSEPESSTPTSAPADETSKDERRDENKTETASDTSAMETSDDKDSSKTETSYEAESNSDISTSEYETKIISGAESGSIDKTSDPQNSNIDETESDTSTSQKADSTNNSTMSEDGSTLFTGENSILFITVLAVCVTTAAVLLIVSLSKRRRKD